MHAQARPRIGEILLARGICTQEQLRVAWEQKVLFGDRLGTNLLALGFVEEETLAQVLAEQQGVVACHGDDIDPRTLRLIPQSLAERHLVVPHHVVDKQLFLLMRDPLDVVAIDAAQFAASMKVVPVVACEARIWRLLERHYGSRGSFRPVTLDGRRAVLDTVPVVAGQLLEEPEELTSEEEFERLYAGMHAPRAEPLDAPALDWATIGSDDAQSQQGILDLVDVSDAPHGVRRNTLRFTHDEAHQLAIEDEPLTFEEASTLLEQTGDRRALATILLRAARSRFERAGLLAVHADRLVGWLGLGDGMDELAGIVIPRSTRSIFSLVVDNRAHYVGPLLRWPVHGDWVKLTGRHVPRTVGLFPILVRGWPVNVLFVDNGHERELALTSDDVGDVLLLAQQVAHGYECLLS